MAFQTSHLLLPLILAIDFIKNPKIFSFTGLKFIGILNTIGLTSASLLL